MVVLQFSQDVLVVMVVLQFSQDLLLVMAVLQFSQIRLVVSVVLQLSQDLLVEHIIVHQQPPSALEADRVQHASWKEFIHHNALAYLWGRTGQDRSG